MAAILILEDESDIGELYRLSLRSQGHEVVGLYADPRQALEAISARPAPDVVLIDERLGHGSGSTYLPELRRAWSGAKFLLVSADPDAVREANDRGFDGAWRKPVTLREICEAVEKLLKSATA